AAELLCLEVGVKVERYVRDARFVRAGEGVDIAFRDGGLRVGSGIGSGRAAEADHAYRHGYREPDWRGDRGHDRSSSGSEVRRAAGSRRRRLVVEFPRFVPSLT